MKKNNEIIEGGKDSICPKDCGKNTLPESLLTSPNPGDWDSLGCSVSSAPGARTKVPLSSSAVCVKGCQRGLAEESTYPPKIHPSLQMFLSSSTSSVVVIIIFFPPSLARYKHDVAVNHVCVSRQLCQAEEECPLLARWRPVCSSEGATRVRMLRLRFEKKKKRKETRGDGTEIRGWYHTGERF